MTALDIGEVTRRTGVRPSTLRYYEERGLIAPVGRRGQRRQYAPDVLQRLGLIALGRVAGFRLDEIAGMLTADGEPEIDRQALRDRADDIDRTIRRLVATRDGLRHAAACPAPTHVECPSFQRYVRVAATRGAPSPDG